MRDSRRNHCGALNESISANVTPLCQHLQEDLSPQGESSGKQDPAAELGINKIDEFRRIIPDGGEWPPAAGVAVKNRQDDMETGLQELRLFPVVPPVETTSVEKHHDRPVIVSEFHVSNHTTMIAEHVPQGKQHQRNTDKDSD